MMAAIAPANARPEAGKIEPAPLFGGGVAVGVPVGYSGTPVVVRFPAGGGTYVGTGLLSVVVALLGGTGTRVVG